MFDIRSVKVILPEIELELIQAQQSLEYLHVAGDEQHLLTLQQGLQRCVGALSLAGLNDAALLLISLKDAATFLHQSGTPWTADIISATAYPLFLVPRYCHWVVEQEQRNGPILLDAINHLRQYSNEKALIESQLLGIDIDPKVSPLKGLKQPPAADIKGPLSKIIPLFKNARIAITSKPEEALQLLSKASLHLQKLCGNAPIGEMFWLLGAIIEAMQDGDLRLTKQRRQWLLLVEQHLIALYKDPVEGLKKPLSLAIKREFLALLVLSNSSRERAKKLSSLYRLPTLAYTDRDIALGISRMRQPGSDVYQALVKSILQNIDQMSLHLISLMEGEAVDDEKAQQVRLAFKQIEAAVVMCDLPHTDSLISQCQEDFEQLLKQHDDKATLLRLSSALLCLPERFNVMADQSLNAASKAHWSSVSDSELMPQRHYSESVQIVLQHAVKQISEIIIQLDIAVETECYQSVESLLNILKNLHKCMLMINQPAIANDVNSLYELMEPCSIHADVADIEALSWPIIELQQKLSQMTFQQFSV